MQLAGPLVPPPLLLYFPCPTCSTAVPHAFSSAAVRVLPALYADPNDRRLLGVASKQLESERLMYILTLGVAEVSADACSRQWHSTTNFCFACQTAGPVFPEEQPHKLASCEPCACTLPSVPPLAPQPYQRHGIARRLLDLALRYAAQAAGRAVYLDVASFNEPALRLYRSAGFAELAVLPGFYTIRTGREPVPSSGASA